jgi:single-stranded-DNA-specific exonuclease
LDNIWEIKKYDHLAAKEISQSLGISMPTAILLNQRGIKSTNEAEKFLNVKLQDLTDPFIITGIPEAVQRIERAINAEEKVVVYGDYDVDGICSTVLLSECLTELGCKVNYYVPNRFAEGYGLNSTAIEHLAEQGYNLIITVDCGITSITETEQAARCGMDVIITDHHTPQDVLPKAIAVINPKLDKQPENFNLAGVGVAFLLVRALCYGKIPDVRVFSWLDLVALATVADIVPVLGDNRILVKYGLEKLQETSRAGLRALMKETGLDGKPLLSWHIGFILAPRLNAAGRLGNAETSIELLLSKDPVKARDLAVMLCNLNSERRTIEEAIFKEAVLQVETVVNLEKEPVLVLAGDGWHQGVIGIVASRLSEKYTRPTILITWEGNIGKGSGRSNGEFDLYQALHYCRESLIQFGGHRLAAGLSIEKSQFSKFKFMMCELGKTIIVPEELQKKYRIDVELEYDDITKKLLNELNLIQPYGEANSCPCFALRANEISAPSLVGKNKEHLKFKIGSRALDAIAFNGSQFLDFPWQKCCQDIMFELEENEFRGKKNVQLKIRDMKCTYIPDNVRDKAQVTPLNTVSRRAEKEVNSGQPVLFVYPTYRSLVKHQMAIYNYFLPGIITTLHGRLSRETRITAREQLSSGKARIYLITQSYLKYYASKNNLPDNIHYIVLVWPQDEGKEYEELRNKFDVDIIPAMNKLDVKFIKKEWDFAALKRTLVYANRNQTLEKLNTRLPDVINETGVNDLSIRKLIRKQFSSSANGALVSDGSCTGLSTLENIDELILADVPYGSYEIAAMLDQVTATVELEMSLLFDQQDFKFNHSYLNRIYPDFNLVKDIWKYFKKTGCRSFTQELNELTNNITVFLQRHFSELDLLPVLQILSDLGLCQVMKKGSIMKIKFIKSEVSSLDISESPYYLEGLAEKKVFAGLEEKLYKYLVR